MTFALMIAWLVVALTLSVIEVLWLTGRFSRGTAPAVLPHRSTNQ